MAEFVPGFNQLSFDPNSFAGSSQISGAEHEFNRLNFNIIYGGETKALIMKNYHDIDTRLSYVVLSTDDSLDPDQATELTNILEYELQENEFLVSVELFGRDPTLQVGNMHQIFTKNLRSWDLYTRDNDPREVRVCFSAAKEPTVKSFTFSTYGTSSGLSSFVWNDTKYSCNYTELATTPFVLSKPSLALRYKHDGTVYELDTNKLVKTYGNQRIDGKKVFKKVPQVQGTPVAADDVVNKAYVEKNFISTSSKSSVTGLVKGSNKGGSYCGFSYFKWLLKDGTRLDLKMVENVSATNATAPVLAVWHVVKDLGAQITAPEKKSKAEIEGHRLQAGEFKGTLSYFKVVGKYSAYTGEPWGSYVGTGITGQHEGLLGFAINDLVSPLKAIEFTVGNKGESWQYAFDTLQVTGMNGSNAYDVTYPKKAVNNEVVTVELPFSSVPFVTLDGEQTINGVKTFAKSPKSLAEAVDGNDLITKDFATKNFFARENGARNYDILVKMKNDGTWVGFTQFKVLLSNGTRLDIKHLENVSATSATQPLVAVFKTVTDNAAAIEAPQRQAKTFFDSYQLEEGEYKGTVSFYRVAGGFNPASVDINPWNVYVGNQNANTYDGIYGVHIEQLDKDLRGVNFKFGDAVSTSYAYTCQQCGIVFTTDLGSLEVEYKGDMSDGTEATIELPSDSDILGGFVSVEKDQTIAGAKTFKKKVFITDPDQASEMVRGQVATMESLKAVGLIGKALPDTQYICLWGDLREVKKRHDRDHVSATYEMSELELHTATGQLYLKYMEEISAAVPNSTTPQPYEVGLCVLSRKKEWDNTTDLPVKTNAFLKSYALQPGEFLAKVRVIKGAWRGGLSSGAQTGVAPYGSNDNFAGLFAARAKNDDYAKFSCYMQGVINAETVVNQTFRYAEIIIYNAPAIKKIKLTSARDSYYSIDAADGGINTINAFISTDEKFNSFDKITSYIGGVVTEAADNSTKMYFDEGSKTAGYTTSPKSVEVPLTNYEEGTSQTESADAAYGYLQAVTISNDQDIAGNKTFIKPITCTEPPVENGHLVNKKYVDDELAKLVARIAALEAANP